MNSVFQRSNPAIEKVFAEAGSPKKVMCVPIDYCQKSLSHAVIKLSKT